MPSIGIPELLIILAILLLLFGGARLAGLGKSTGRALREFKEETKNISAKDEQNTQLGTPAATDPVQPPQQHQQPQQQYQQPPQQWQQPPAGSIQDPGSEVRRDS